MRKIAQLFVAFSLRSQKSWKIKINHQKWIFFSYLFTKIITGWNILIFYYFILIQKVRSIFVSRIWRVKLEIGNMKPPLQNWGQYEVCTKIWHILPKRISKKGTAVYSKWGAVATITESSSTSDWMWLQKQ